MFVGDITRLNARHRAHSEALIMGDRRLTYAELDALVNRTASALRRRGIGSGDRVAALGRNSIEYVALYYATAKIGAMLVPLNFWHRTGEHEYAIDDADPALFFVAADLRPAVEPVIEARQLPTVPLPVKGESGVWDEFLAGASGNDPAAALADDTCHMILYTSGTTGQPKGAMLSHRRTVDDGISMAAALGVRETDTFMNYFPPFHVGNWDHMKLFHIMGARVVLLTQFDAGEVLRLLPLEQVTVILAVPTMLNELLNHPSFENTDRSSVRLLYYGAYDPSGIMARTAEVFGAREGRTEMAHTYGLTEGGPFVTLCPPADVFRHWGSIGRPLPGVEVALLDDAGKEVAAGQAGEICFRGPRMSGYWRKPEESAAALEGGWLHSGDVAIADEDGFLTIVDRKKDMIRTGGQNVYSKQIEDCLLLHEAVQDVAIIGLPDPEYEERVCAVVVLKDRTRASDELKAAIQAHVRQQLAGYNTPREVIFAEELPKNAVGKTQKHVLRAKYGSMFGHRRPAAKL